MALKSSNKVDTNRYQLEVEIDGASFEKAVDQAYRKQNKKIMIPGFRKGKAPRAFVDKSTMGQRSSMRMPSMRSIRTRWKRLSTKQSLT